MRLTLVTPPAVLPVSLREARAQCRVDGDDEDLLIQHYLDAAVSRLDGYGGILGRCLIRQSWRAEVTQVGERIRVPFPDAEIVQAVFTDPVAGDMAWRWHESLAAPAIVPLGGWGRPASIIFTAGYGPEPEDVPAALRQAILMLVDHWFRHRGGTDLPTGFDEVVSPWRVRRL